MNLREIITDRGLGVQAVGFITVAATCVSLLELYSGYDHWAYKAFETAVTRIYWAFIPPLAFVFDRVWKMFETRAKLRQQMEQEIEKRVREKVAVEVLDAMSVPVEERKRILETLRASQEYESNGQNGDTHDREWQAQMLAEIRGLRLDLQRDQLRENVVKEVQQEAMSRILDDLKRHGIDIPPEIAPDDGEDAS